MKRDVKRDLLGHVTIGGRRFPVEGIELSGGEVRLSFTVPPGPSFGGPITVFGADGLGCWQGKTIFFPERDFCVRFRYGIRQARILSGDEFTDASQLPGWA